MDVCWHFLKICSNTFFEKGLASFCTKSGLFLYQLLTINLYQAEVLYFLPDLRICFYTQITSTRKIMLFSYNVRKTKLMLIFMVYRKSIMLRSKLFIIFYIKNIFYEMLFLKMFIFSY